MCLIIMKYILIYFKSKMSLNQGEIDQESPIFTPLCMVFPREVTVSFILLHALS